MTVSGQVSFRGKKKKEENAQHQARKIQNAL
jgi:hypothetical protein